MGASAQEFVALAVVGVAFAVVFRSLYRKYAVGPLSAFFLRRGRVALAMRIRGGKMTTKSCGGDCGCD